MNNQHTQVVVAERPPCDFCKSDGTIKPAMIDGKTKMGPWANMCNAHYRSYGIGLGLGKGQRLMIEVPMDSES